MILYSASTGLFYDTDLGAETPSDVVEVSREDHQKLLDGQTDGKVISSSADGQPVLIERPPLTVEELTAMAFGSRDNMLSFSAIRIAPLQDAVDMDQASDEEVASLATWKQYRIDLNRIHLQKGFPEKIKWPASPEELAATVS
jgi:hypothetical protein